MKVNRHGKAAALSADQFTALLNAAPSARYQALWSVQRWTAARIGEALSLAWADVAGDRVTYRRANTKTQTTRQVPQGPHLKIELERYRQAWQDAHGRPPKPYDVLFPGACSTTSPMTRQAADKALRMACSRLGLMGVTPHSFRRSAAQDAVSRGVPLHVIQALTGHKSLGSLGEYLAATEEEVLAAIGG
ncbi:MAG: site-specific integrase [Synechococcaceae cyanobacterium]|nr:site-specific integrase [Synechococcaceae cyanobacterium]